MKITFMGAGSAVFARNVIGDCMCSEALRDSTFALYDIDGERLNQSAIILEAMRQAKGGYGKIECYLGVENRKEALRGADFVVNAIQVGLYEPCTVTDFEVPKKYGLRQTIGDTLGIGGIMRGLRTINVLEDFERDIPSELSSKILTLLDKHPYDLSGGEQQRVSIGRALMNAPAVMLADEPTGNLDSESSKEVLDLLKLCQERYHQTILMVTHDESMAQYADRVIKIADGKIILDQ